MQFLLGLCIFLLLFQNARNTFISRCHEFATGVVENKKEGRRKMRKREKEIALVKGERRLTGLSL